MRVFIIGEEVSLALSIGIYVCVCVCISEREGEAVSKANHSSSLKEAGLNELLGELIKLKLALGH